MDIVTQVTMCEMAAANASTRLTAQCDVGKARSVLSLVVGPRKELSREGIEKSRSWINKNMPLAEVRSGDFPVSKPRIRAKRMTGILLLSGFKNIPRVRKLEEIAKTHRFLRPPKWPRIGV